MLRAIFSLRDSSTKPSGPSGNPATPPATLGTASSLLDQVLRAVRGPSDREITALDAAANAALASAKKNREASSAAKRYMADSPDTRCNKQVPGTGEPAAAFAENAVDADQGPTPRPASPM